MNDHWPIAHVELAKKCFRDGLSNAETAAFVNKTFNTNYSRSAVCGRLKRARVWRSKFDTKHKTQIPLRFGIDISISGRA